MSNSIIECEKGNYLVQMARNPVRKSRSMKRTVLRNYKGVSLFARLFLKLRWRFTPYEEIAAQVPAKGLIYDLGCGHGLLSLTLALQSARRTVHAVDHDERRIWLARQAARNFLNVHFCQGNITQVLKEKKAHAAAIVVMDAMHYLLPQEQVRLLGHARAALVPGGLFLMREVDTTAGLTSWINKTHERAMTFSGFTQAERLTFRSPEEWEGMFRDAGFCVASKPCGFFPFADRLFVCQKT